MPRCVEESVLLFHYVDAKGSNSDSRAWQQAYLSAELFHQWNPHSHRYIPMNEEFPSKISNTYYHLLFFLTHSLSSLGDCYFSLPHEASVRAVSGFMRWG